MTLRYPLFNVQINVPVEESNNAVRGKRRKTRSAKPPRTEKVSTEEPSTKAEEKVESTKPAPDPTQPVLMIEVENMKHNAYKQTEEVKALTQEVIKTIRDIITMNPLYRLVVLKFLDIAKLRLVIIPERVFNKCYIKTKELLTIQYTFVTWELLCLLLSLKSFRKSWRRWM